MVQESTTASHSLTEQTEQLSRLIGQFDVGRSAGAEPLRRELRKVAPHAFAAPAAAPPGRGAKPVAVARPRPRPKAVAAAALSAPVDNDGWSEF
jgi:methyl-accepting chemotaxis protein